MAVIYANQGRYTNPWEQMLPTFLSQMILQAHGNKLRKELMQQEETYKQQELEQEEAMISGQEPKNLPSSLYAYRGAKGWNVIQKPKDENEADWTHFSTEVEGKPVEAAYNKKNPALVKILGPTATKNAPEKPTNMPPWFDSMRVEMLGNESETPEGRKKFADYMMTDEGKKKAAAYREEYARQTASPSIQFLQTDKGIVPAFSRGPEMGKVGEPTGLGKPMPSEMIVAEQQIGTLKKTFGRVKSNYNQNYVGPIAGRVGAFQEQWTGLPEKQASFYADLAQIDNTLIYLMSGKQINEGEYKRLRKQLPEADLPVPVFNARMKTFEKTLTSILDERHKNMGSYGKQPESKPTINNQKSDWIKAAKVKNPNSSDDELSNYYDQKYGK